MTSSCHQDWDEFTPLVPVSDDSNEYVNNVLGCCLHIPFKSVLFNGVELSTTGTVEVKHYNREKIETSLVFLNSSYFQAHVVNRRGVRAEQLPRELAPACIVTRDRNQDIVREEQAAKRAVRAARKRDEDAKNGRSSVPPSGMRTIRGRADVGVRVREDGHKSGQEVKRSAEEKAGDVTAGIVVAQHVEAEARQRGTQSARSKSRREVRSRTTISAKEVSVKKVTNSIKITEPTDIHIANVANEAEPIAEPKKVPIREHSPSKRQLCESEEKNDSYDEDDSSDWEGKPTVSWNEDTVAVFNRWSSSGSSNDDEYQSDDVAGEHSAESTSVIQVLGRWVSV